MFDHFFNHSPGALRLTLALVAVAGFALACGLRARQAWRTRRDFFPRPHRPWPPLVWHAALILLPMAALTTFGLWTMLQQRRAVETAARQQASQLLQALPEDLGRRAASRLAELDAARTGWLQHLQHDDAAWPEDPDRLRWVADPTESIVHSNNLTVLRATDPGWRDGPPPFIACSFPALPAGSPAPDAVPVPPAWRLAFSPRQQQAWLALRAASAAGSNSAGSTNPALPALLRAFRLSRPPADAMAGAEFLALQAGLPSPATTNELDRLLRFAAAHAADVSDAGLPLGTLATAMALGLARECGPDEALWVRLQSEVASPNLLTPLLLDAAGGVAANHQDLAGSVAALRLLLADHLQQAALARALQQTGATPATNLWLDALDQRWLCLLSPSPLDRLAHPGRTPAPAGHPPEAECYSASALSHAFATALGGSGLGLPDYFSLALRLENQPVALPPARTRGGGDAPPGAPLATRDFYLSQPAFLSRPGPDGRPEMAPFEAMPGHPRFTLQIFLTNRQLLLARQGRQQLLTGALILLAALSSVAGLAAAALAFRREQRLNVLKSNFVSSVSHELRAPIASVRLMAENLERGKVTDPARQAAYFRFMGRECARLSALIENILDFSRLEQGRYRCEFEPTDLAALVRTVAALFEPAAAEKGVRLVCACPPANPPWEAVVDGRALQQALVNLLDNALKHSQPGQVVTLAAADAGADGCTFAVTDQGPGVPAAEQEKIFERFYRLGSELRRETQGIGIGLSIVRQIATAHGGRVTVRSAPGQGSCFTLTLPRR